MEGVSSVELQCREVHVTIMAGSVVISTLMAINQYDLWERSQKRYFRVNQGKNLCLQSNPQKEYIVNKVGHKQSESPVPCELYSTRVKQFHQICIGWIDLIVCNSLNFSEIKIC